MEGLRADVNKVSIDSRRSYQTAAKYKEGRSSSKQISFACGRTGHIAKDPQCPAKNQNCRKCHLMVHFQIRCKSKQAKSQKIDRPQKTDPKRVHQIEEGEPYYAFAVRKISENNCDSAIDV